MKANKLNDEESAEKLMEEFGEEVEEKLIGTEQGGPLLYS